MDWVFWCGTVIFLATYILIATEKVHKVICALGGAALMFILVLGRKAHGEHGGAELDAFAANVNFDVIFTL